MNATETGRYIVHLIFSLLNNKKPEEKPDDISFEDVFKMSVRHNVSVMTLAAVQQLDQKPDETVLNKWNRKSISAIAQGVVQLSERDKIYQKFEENTIQYIPLKGCLLKEMYPKIEYREMSDLDILIQENDQEKVREIMESIGYITESFRERKDDSYRKKPFMHVEMHHRLLEERTIERMDITDYFLLNPFDCAVFEKDSQKGCFTWNDFYVYLVVHLAKHYFNSGIGIRQLIDLVIFRKNYEIDDTYVEDKLRNMHLYDYMKQTEQLLNMWNEGKAPTDDLSEMETIIFTSGSYGGVESRVRNCLRKISENGNPSRFHYILYRVFPPYRLMKTLYPILKKIPVLLPFCWLYRILFNGLPKIGKYIREMQVFKKVQSEKHNK